MFKKILFPLFVTAGLMFSGCSSFPFCCPDSVISTVPTVVNLTWDASDVLNFDTINLTATDQWLAIHPTWVSLNFTSGVGDQTIVVTPVGDNNGATVITGTITFLAANGDQVTVTVRQNPILLDPSIDVSTDITLSATDLFNDLVNKGSVLGYTFEIIDETGPHSADFPSTYYVEVGPFPDVASLTIGSETWSKTDIVRVGVGDGNFVEAAPFKVDANVLWIAAPLMMVEGADGELSLGTFGSITTEDLNAAAALEMVAAVAGYGAAMTPPGSVVALNTIPDASGRYLIAEERLQGEAWVEWTVAEGGVDIKGIPSPFYQTIVKAYRHSTGVTWYNMLFVGDNAAHTSFNSSGYFAGDVTVPKTEVIDYYYIVPNHGNVSFQITTEDAIP